MGARPRIPARLPDRPPPLGQPPNAPVRHELSHIVASIPTQLHADHFHTSPTGRDIPAREASRAARRHAPWSGPLPRAPIALWIALLFGLTLSPTASTAASLTRLATLFGLEESARVTPRAISADGSTIVGEFVVNVEDEDGETHRRSSAYHWSAQDGLTVIEDAANGIAGSSAVDVSADGSVVVGMSRSGPYRWDAQTGLQILPNPNPQNLDLFNVNAISADGSTIVGNAGIGPSPYGRIVRGYRWTNENGVRLIEDQPGAELIDAHGVSADGSVVAGHGLSGFGIEAQRWNAESGIVGLGGVIGGGNITFATATSDDGLILIGTSVLNGFVPGIPNNGTIAFRWMPWTGMQPLGDLAGGRFLSEAAAVSANGQIIVGRGVSDILPRAFIWDPVNLIRPLDVVLAELGLDLGGLELQTPTGISGDGTIIIGTGGSAIGAPDGWIAVIPEPSTAVLLGVGLSALSLRRRD